MSGVGESAIVLRWGCNAEAGSGASDQALMWGSSRSGDVGVKVKAGDVGVSRWGSVTLSSMGFKARLGDQGIKVVVKAGFGDVGVKKGG